MRGQGVVGARTDVSQGPDARTSAADESVALRSSSPPVSSNPEMSPVDSGGRLYLFLRTQPPRGTGAKALAYENRLTRCDRGPVENLHTANAPSCVNRLGQGRIRRRAWLSKRGG